MISICYVHAGEDMFDMIVDVMAPMQQASARQRTLVIEVAVLGTAGKVRVGILSSSAGGVSLYSTFNSCSAPGSVAVGGRGFDTGWGKNGRIIS